MKNELPPSLKAVMADSTIPPRRRLDLYITWAGGKQKEAARDLGLSQPTLAGVRARGRRPGQSPTLRTLEKIAATGIPARDWL